MAYGIGGISGCHINPAVSFGMLVARRLSFVDFIKYSVAQSLGGIAGAFVLLIILKSQIAGYDVAASGLGQNGWGIGYLGEYALQAALIFEVIATFLFVIVILGVTQEKTGNASIAGLAIGLTLVVIHIVGINVTGVSVNPARSLGPALLVGGHAISQLWLFIVAPMAGAAIAGAAHKYLLYRGA